MVRLEGFEPSTSGSTNQRSNQLSYSRTCFVSASKPFSCQPTQTIRLIVNICGNFIKQKMRYVQWRTNASDQLRNLKFRFVLFVGSERPGCPCVAGQDLVICQIASP